MAKSAAKKEQPKEKEELDKVESATVKKEKKSKKDDKKSKRSSFKKEHPKQHDDQKNADNEVSTDAVVGKKRKRSKDGESKDNADNDEIQATTTTTTPQAEAAVDTSEKKRSKKKAKAGDSDDKESKKKKSKKKADEKESVVKDNSDVRDEAKDTQTSSVDNGSSEHDIKKQETSQDSSEEDTTRWGYDDKAMIKMYGSNADEEHSDSSDDDGEKDDDNSAKAEKDKNAEKEGYDEQLPYTFDENDNPIYVETQDDKEIFLCKLCPAKKMETAKQVATHLASGHHARRLNKLKKQKSRIAKGLPPVPERKQQNTKEEQEDPDKPFEMPIIKTRGKNRTREDILKFAKLQKLSNQTRKEERESQLAAKLDEKRRMAIIQLKRDGKEPTAEAVAEIVWQWTEDERLERIKRRRIKRIEVKLRTGRIKAKPRGKEGKNELKYLPRNLEKWLDNAKKRKLKRKQRKENRKKVEEKEAAQRKKGLLKALDSMKDIQ